MACSITGQQVARFLSQLREQRQAPNNITFDNDTKFTCKAMVFWNKETMIRLNLIQPRKPTQNAFVERLNGRFRDSWLNQYWFRSINEARTEIDQWRHHYNYERPHSSLNYLTLVAFANKAA